METNNNNKWDSNPTLEASASFHVASRIFLSNFTKKTFTLNMRICCDNFAILNCKICLKSLHWRLDVVSFMKCSFVCTEYIKKGKNAPKLKFKRLDDICSVRLLHILVFWNIRSLILMCWTHPVEGHTLDQFDQIWEFVSHEQYLLISFYIFEPYFPINFMFHEQDLLIHFTFRWKTNSQPGKAPSFTNQHLS